MIVAKPKTKRKTVGNNRRLNNNNRKSGKKTTLDLKYITLTHDQIIEDYRLAFQSRHASLLGRKEVM
ncbi:hypothetical protein MJD09_12740, partial [bacterium]|nr:hypothetical protein [bacterium]